MTHRPEPHEDAMAMLTACVHRDTDRVQAVGDEAMARGAEHTQAVLGYVITVAAELVRWVSEDEDRPPETLLAELGAAFARGGDDGGDGDGSGARSGDE